MSSILPGFVERSLPHICFLHFLADIVTHYRMFAAVTTGTYTHTQGHFSACELASGNGFTCSGLKACIALRSALGSQRPWLGPSTQEAERSPSGGAG